MAYPAVATVLDDFTGTPGVLGSNWSDGMYASGATNQGLRKETSGGQSFAYSADVSDTWVGSYWNQSMFQDVEVYAIINRL